MAIGKVCVGPTNQKSLRMLPRDERENRCIIAWCGLDVENLEAQLSTSEICSHPAAVSPLDSRTATRDNPGRRSFSNSIRLTTFSRPVSAASPVIFPPGRARLSIRPSFTGSPKDALNPRLVGRFFQSHLHCKNGDFTPLAPFDGADLNPMGAEETSRIPVLSPHSIA